MGIGWSFYCLMLVAVLPLDTADYFCCPGYGDVPTSCRAAASDACELGLHMAITPHHVCLDQCYERESQCEVECGGAE